MKSGLCVPLRRYATPEFIRTLGTASERLGFDELWVGERVVMFDEHQSDFPGLGRSSSNRRLHRRPRTWRRCSNGSRKSITSS